MPYTSQPIVNYIFRVKFAHRKSVYRDLEIYGDWDLRQLAGLILKSVKFDFDHMCGFYSNFKNMYDSEEKYESFADYPDNDLEQGENSKPLSGTLIQDVFEPKNKMLFYFDYGDSWEFEVTCTKITDVEKTKNGILKEVGKAPKQYPGTKKGQEEWLLFH